MKGKRIFIWVVLCVVLLIGTQTRTAAEEKAVSGKCGDDLYWSYADGTLTVTGSGAMYDFDYYYPHGIGDSDGSTAPWRIYRDDIRYVVLPDKMTHLGEMAFYLCSNLETIHLPEGIPSIGINAFCGCNSLKEINIPESVRTIVNHAFLDCEQLSDVRIPDGVTSIGTYAFSQCDNLKEINIPKGLTTIPSGFVRMDGLIQEIIVPEGVTTIEDCAFEDLGSLTKLVLSEGLTTIGDRAFNNCNLLYDIRLPESLTAIENDTLGTGAFTKTGYWERYVEENGFGPVYLDFALIGCEGDCPETVYIKKGTTLIAAYTFWNHSEIKEVVLSSGIEEINTGTFAGCRNLQSITVPTTVTRVGLSAFLGANQLTDVYYLGTEETFKAQLKPNIATGGNAIFYSENGAGATWHFLDADPIASVELNPEDVQFKGTTPYTVYNGSEQTPRVIVKNANGDEIKLYSYTAMYRSNYSPGTAYADVLDHVSGELFSIMFKIYLPATKSTTVENVQNGIRLKWAKVPDARGYVIYRRAWNLISSGWTEFKRWNNTTATEWTDTNVYAGTRYQYGVKAYFDDPMDNYNLGLVGPLKTTVRITTRTLKSVTPGSRRMTVKWDGSKLFTGYQIQYAMDQGFTKDAVAIKITNPQTYSTTVTGLRSGKTYYVRLRSYHVFEGMTYFGQWSEVLTCKVK